MDIPATLILAIIYVGMNILAFFTFAHDKLKARANTWRTPENSLLFLAALGPFGALTAMQVFRHKTRQVKFYIVPLFALLHMVLIIWFWPLFSL
jgi:uncharacterized membrane protein YsdA (DUF1294 family)